MSACSIPAETLLRKISRGPTSGNIFLKKELIKVNIAGSALPIGKE